MKLNLSRKLFLLVSVFSASLQCADNVNTAQGSQDVETQTKEVKVTEEPQQPRLRKFPKAKEKINFFGFNPVHTIYIPTSTMLVILKPVVDVNGNDLAYLFIFQIDDDQYYAFLRHNNNLIIIKPDDAYDIFEKHKHQSRNVTFVYSHNAVDIALEISKLDKQAYYSLKYLPDEAVLPLMDKVEELALNLPVLSKQKAKLSDKFKTASELFTSIYKTKIPVQI